MPESNHETALLSIEKVLTLLRSVQTLEGTDKDGVEHLLEMAMENLRVTLTRLQSPRNATTWGNAGGCTPPLNL